MGAFRMGSARMKTSSTFAFAAPASALTGAVLILFACGDATTTDHTAYAEIVAEEDARGESGLDRTRHHLASDDPAVRRLAVRALGRLEDPGQLTGLEAMTDDPDPAVRASVAMAMAQSVFRIGSGADEPGNGAGQIEQVSQALTRRIEVESDPTVLGALATSLGRLAHPDADARAAVESGLVAAVRRAAEVRRAATRSGNSTHVIARPPCQTDACQPLLGLARGIEAFARRAPGVPLSEDLLTATVRLSSVLSGEGADSEGVADAALAAARVRRLAAAALVHANQLAPADIVRLLRDEDWGVRRQAVISALRHGTDAGPTAGPTADTDTDAAIPAGLGDPDPRVRVEALRAYDRWVRPEAGCAAILRAMDDEDPHVANTAIALLGRPCPDLETQRQALANRAAELTDEESDWRGPARALDALAAVAAVAQGEAASGVAGAARHANACVRAWAARAAARSADEAVLTALSGDSDANVREAALRGLGEVAGAGGSEAYLAALASNDPQLVMTATRLLVAHTPAETPVSALLAPLARFTSAQRETERDVRAALLDGIGSVGGFSRDDLAPYLTDFDPLIAERAAALLTETFGEAVEAAPRRLPRAPTPDAARLAELQRSAVVLHMAGLGDIVIALRSDLAATNADRFARLAAEGYFDGLTFHRVEPNFVIQGGSPHANEFAGDGPYSRDEISGAAHLRGTVGLSTRGRDTGDAQIFINLADNLRLDFNYTIYGVVVEGMEVVDAIQEGAVIETAEVLVR